MAIPLTMLWKVRISLRKKAVLISIFSLVVITMAFAIIRERAVSTSRHQFDTSWLYMSSALEQAIGKSVLFLNKTTYAPPIICHQSSKKDLILSNHRRMPCLLSRSLLAAAPLFSSRGWSKIQLQTGIKQPPPSQTYQITYSVPIRATDGIR